VKSSSVARPVAIDFRINFHRVEALFWLLLLLLCNFILVPKKRPVSHPRHKESIDPDHRPFVFIGNVSSTVSYNIYEVKIAYITTKKNANNKQNAALRHLDNFLFPWVPGGF